jgi:cobalamin biosynthesis Mg chelatase CobN
MIKVKVLALLSVMALFLTIPAVVSAQAVPPNAFVGTASIDSAASVDGTSVTAWVDGTQAGSDTVTGGSYSLLVDQGEGSFAGKTVSFKVGGFDAAETTTWEQGGATVLNLTALSGAPTPTPAPTGGTGADGADGPAGPRGPAGATGADGADGAAGSAGLPGPAGSAGLPGSAGSAGSTGSAGIAGVDGSSGLAVTAIILAILAIVVSVVAGYLVRNRQS